MKKTMKRSFIGAVMLSLALVGCSNSTSTSSDSNNKSTSVSKSGGTLKIAITNDANGIGYEPDIRTLSDMIISSTALETLGRFDSKGEIKPFLADSWNVDTTAKTITFKLKKGIKFQDGTDFNAEAVKWNFDQYQAAEKPIINARDTLSTDVIDDQTVRVNLKDWNSSALTVLATTIELSSPTAFQKNGKDWAITHPVGTGPFVFESWDKNVAVKFKKNPNYWQKGKPYLDGVEWDVVADPMTQEASFKNGDFDMIFNASTQTANNLKSDYKIVKLTNGMGAAGTSLAPDSKDPKSPFANVKVRQALNYAINKKSIVSTIFSGSVIQTNQWALPGSPIFNEDVKYSYNPNKAKELLKEAGYPDGFKTSITFVNSPDNTQLYTAIQGDLAKVGIDAKLNPVAQPTHQQMTSQGGWTGLISCTFRVDADVPAVMMRFLGNSTFYVTTKREDQVNQMLSQATVATSQDEKNKITQELQKTIFVDNAMNIPLYVTSMPTVKTSKVTGDGINQNFASYWTPENAKKSK